MEGRGEMLLQMIACRANITDEAGMQAHKTHKMPLDWDAHEIALNTSMGEQIAEVPPDMVGEHMNKMWIVIVTSFVPTGWGGLEKFVMFVNVHACIRDWYWKYCSRKERHSTQLQTL